MIKNRPRNASRRASRGFFPASPGTPAGPNLLEQLTAKLHHTRTPVESKKFRCARWTILVFVLAFLAGQECLTAIAGQGSYRAEHRQTPELTNSYDRIELDSNEGYDGQSGSAG